MNPYRTMYDLSNQGVYCSLLICRLLTEGIQTVINEPRREKMGLRTYANSKASGEPAHPCSLASSFAVCLKFYKGLLLVKANSKASCETAWMCRLTRSFAVCICPKAHFLMTWLILCSWVYTIAKYWMLARVNRTTNHICHKVKSLILDTIWQTIKQIKFILH